MDRNALVEAVSESPFVSFGDVHVDRQDRPSEGEIEVSARQSSSAMTLAVVHVQPAVAPFVLAADGSRGSSSSGASVDIAHSDNIVPSSPSGRRADMHLTQSQQSTLLYKIEEACLGSYMRPFAWPISCVWKAPRRSDEFLRARGLKRISFLNLWRRRSEWAHDVELAIERTLAVQLALFGASMLLLLYSILQLLTQKAPGTLDACYVRGFDPVNPAWMDYTGVPNEHNTFNSTWVTTNLGAGQGYAAIDGTFGVCVIPPSITVTLSQSVLTQTLAWLVSWIGLFAWSFGYLLYFASGSVAILLRCVRSGAPLPSFVVTKRYYASNRVIVGMLLFLSIATMIGLAIVVFFPNMHFSTRYCPTPKGERGQITCWFRYASLQAQWSVFISEFQICISCLLLVKTMSALLSAIRDPFATLPPKAILLDTHGRTSMRSADGEASHANEADEESQTGKHRVAAVSALDARPPSVSEPEQPFSVLSHNLLLTLREEDEYTRNELADSDAAGFGARMRNTMLGTPMSPKNRGMITQHAAAGSSAADHGSEWASALLDDSLQSFEHSLKEQTLELQWRLETAEKALGPLPPGRSRRKETSYTRSVRRQLHELRELQAMDVTNLRNAKAQRFAAWCSPAYLQLDRLAERSTCHTLLAIVYRALVTAAFAIVPIGLCWSGVLVAAFWFTTV